MATNTRRPKGRVGLVSALNAAIEALNHAKEISSINPAKAAYGSVSVLLTMISVRSPLSCGDELPADLQPGSYQQLPGLRRDRTQLRRYLYSARPGNKWEETGRPQSVSVRGNKPVDGVGYLIQRCKFGRLM